MASKQALIRASKLTDRSLERKHMYASNGVWFLATHCLATYAAPTTVWLMFG